MDTLLLPSTLRYLRFGMWFDQKIDHIQLPANLQRLMFGSIFDQSMDKVCLPQGLKTLAFGFHFRQALDQVIFPASLQWLLFEDRVMMLDLHPTAELESNVRNMLRCTVRANPTLPSCCHVATQSIEAKRWQPW